MESDEQKAARAKWAADVAELMGNLDSPPREALQSMFTGVLSIILTEEKIDPKELYARTPHDYIASNTERTLGACIFAISILTPGVFPEYLDGKAGRVFLAHLDAFVAETKKGSMQ